MTTLDHGNRPFQSFFRRVPAITPLLVSLALLASCQDTTEPGKIVTLPPMTSAGTFLEIQSVTGLKAYISGNTRWTYDIFHGTQVEYNAADGKTFLWYPGNTRILPGRWEVRKGFIVPELCYLYGTNSYNPVTGLPGGKWECDTVKQLGYIIQGDPFGLSHGLPTVIPDRHLYLPADLMRMAGKKPADLKYVTRIRSH
ncbi:MAG: hypothetical protein Q9M41_08745 [Paracoccaceae bacterium]|nr:hypothetical protein [Paracoccaceae bacterium]